MRIKPVEHKYGKPKPYPVSFGIYKGSKMTSYGEYTWGMFKGYRIEIYNAKEYALIDFDEALEFYRGVALIDSVGEKLGITPEQMTKFFETGDWHELTNEEEK